MSNRKERGLNERIYLLSASNHNNKWELTVKGSSNKVYKILLSKEKINCKCMDFTIRKKICKHLYFIFVKVLNSTFAINDNDIESIKNKFNEISDKLYSILSNHVGTCEKIEYDKSDSCCICFEDFGDEDIIQCKMTCKNVFHMECINLWLSKNKNCPLCRSTWNACSDNYLTDFKGLEN